MAVVNTYVDFKDGASCSKVPLKVEAYERKNIRKTNGGKKNERYFNETAP